MTNPGGINLNISPYFDDFDEDKKFTRILYRPGRAVQARELTQGQSLQQKQIERFANFFFKQGSIVQGCEQTVDLDLDYVKLQSTFDSDDVLVSNFLEKEVVGQTTGIRAFIGLVADLSGDDPKTLYINYLTAGAVRVKIPRVANAILIPTDATIGGTVRFRTAAAPTVDVVTATLVDFDIDPTDGGVDDYIWVNNLSAAIGDIPISGADEVLIPATSADVQPVYDSTILDSRSASKFVESEILMAGVYGVRFYANAATANATKFVVDAGLATEVTYTKASKSTIDEGIMYIADHFVKHTAQTIILDKYSNVPSYKIGLIPTKTFVDSAADSSLLDNAQGTENFQAPGADRLKIDTTLAKVSYTEVTDGSDFVSMIEIEDGIIKKRRDIELEGKIEEAIAKRTSDESGDYTLSDPRISVREHLNTGSNGGRYSAGEGGDSDLLLLEVDPFVAYVSGYRNEIISRANIEISKGLDTQEVEQVNTQINLGSYITTNEFIGFWNFENSIEVDLYDTAQTVITNKSFDNAGFTPAGTKIGTVRIKSIEYVSGETGEPTTQYNLYTYDIKMNAGKTFQEVRSLYQNNLSVSDCVADIVLDAAGNAVVKEQTFDRLLFKLPYGSIKTLRDSNGQLENGFRFRREFSLTLSNGTGTISSTSTNETFVGTGTLSELQKKNNYLVIPQTTLFTSAVEVDNVTTNGTTAISTDGGTGGSFTADFVVGDYIAINGTGDDTDGIFKITAIADDNNLTIDAAHPGSATGLDIYKVFPGGLPIRLDGSSSGSGTRTLSVTTPTAITLDLDEQFDGGISFVATMDRSNAREIKKNVIRDRQIKIEPTATGPGASAHPNGTSGPYSLGHSDIYALKAIYQAADFTVNATTSDTNVTSDYTLDNGQRDNLYENGKITPNVGVVPTGNLLVVFDFFTHDTTQGVGYLSIDSYPIDDAGDNTTTTIRTTDVPTYVSLKNGAFYDLRNTLDFRPIKLNSTNGATNPAESTTFDVPVGGGGLHFPAANSDFQADLQYYKGRKSKLYMNNKGELAVIDGSPGYPNPSPPPSVPDSIDLAELEIPAFPSLPKNVVVSPKKNRRFTMQDIGKLQERINNLEYYTSLNLLEKESRDKVIVDSDGIDRFKNGILVDAFTGHSVADVGLPSYRAAINREGKYATTYFDNDNQVRLEYNSTTSSGVTKTAGNKLMLNYTEHTFADQPYASQTLRLTQSFAFSWVGDMKVVPATDNWLQTTRNPNSDLVSDLTGESDNWKSLTYAWNTEVNPATRHWIGTPNKSLSFTSANTEYDISRTAAGQTSKQQIQDSTIDITTSDLNIAVNRVSDISISHVMRVRDFAFECNGLRDGSQMYAFFDGVDVTSNCKQIALVGTKTLNDLNDLYDNDGTLTVDTNYWTEVSTTELRAIKNKVYGIFTVPANSFYVGYRELKLIDDALNRDSVATTVAKYSIRSSGLGITRGLDSINTRPLSVAVDESNYVSKISRVNSTSKNYTDVNYKRYDPLSQSFYIDESTYPRGIFLSSIDLFFQSKSGNNNLGVTVEIREMQNGFPTRKIIGNEVSRVENSNIAVSADSTVATTFTFPSPIYLFPGTEYCFSVKPDGNSRDYQIWTAVLGEKDITDSTVGKSIEDEPAAGILFASTNNFTWSIRQNQDLKFKLKIAEFSTTTNGSVYFNNTNIGSNVDFSRITTNIENLTIADTDIQYSINMYDSNLEQSGYLSVKNLERLELTKQYRINNTVDTPSLNILSTLSTDNKYISPYIDLERVNVIPEDLDINNSTETTLTGTVTVTSGQNDVVGVGTLFTSEVDAGEYIKVGNDYRVVSAITDDTNLITTQNFRESVSGVTAQIQFEEAPAGTYTSNSRYISRRVALNDGFEASDIKVFVDVNRPAGTDVKVYYRILNESDQDSFDLKFYSEMSLDGTPAINQDSNTYAEERYVIPTANLTGGVQILYGTVSVTNSSVTVSGTGTRFTEELRIGDTVAIGPDRITGVVATIGGNETLTLESGYTGTTLSGLEIFEVLNNVVGYTTEDLRSYSGFKYFSIKVVFLSSNLGYAPRIKNLRAIALA